MLCYAVVVLYLCLCCVGCEQAVKVLLNSVPEHVQFDGVLEDLQAVRGVTSVHDLHIWGMSTTESALTVHLVMPGGAPGDAFLKRLAQELEQRFGIHHATVQIEQADKDCALHRAHAH